MKAWSGWQVHREAEWQLKEAEVPAFMTVWAERSLLGRLWGRRVALLFPNGTGERQHTPIELPSLGHPSRGRARGLTV